MSLKQFYSNNFTIEDVESNINNITTVITEIFLNTDYKYVIEDFFNDFLENIEDNTFNLTETFHIINIQKILDINKEYNQKNSNISLLEQEILAFYDNKYNKLSDELQSCFDFNSELELKKFLLGTQTNITELFNYIHETLPFQSKLNDNEINVNDIDVNSKQEIDLLIQLSKADLQKMFFDRILDTTSNFVKKIKEELTEKNSLILYRGTVLSPHDFHSTVLGEKDNVGIHFSFSEHIASDFASNPNPEVVNSVLKADIKLSEIDVLSTLLYENLGIFEEEEIRLFDFSTFQALEIENSIQGCKYPINKEFKGHQNNLLFEKLQNIYFEFTSKTINFQELQTKLYLEFGINFKNEAEIVIFYKDMQQKAQRKAFTHSKKKPNNII